MRIFGIDPGTAIVGYGVVDISPEGAFTAVDFGVVSTPAHTPYHQRLAQIYEDLTTLLQKWQPDRAAVEKLFFYQMGNTISIAQARGVILLCLAQQSVPFHEFSPPQVKLTLAGHGRADKRAVQEAVQRELGLDKIPKPDDAADGLAIALTCWFLERSVL
jgi:crossover junction endodeoxyribonuclease RuvC